MLRGGIRAGVVALPLVLYPVEYLNTFAVAHLPAQCSAT